MDVFGADLAVVYEYCFGSMGQAHEEEKMFRSVCHFTDLWKWYRRVMRWGRLDHAYQGYYMYVSPQFACCPAALAALAGGVVL
jgi:hypothetical protein